MPINRSKFYVPPGFWEGGRLTDKDGTVSGGELEEITVTAPKYTEEQKSKMSSESIRQANENPYVQTAKLLDPTGISNWPDLYYAAKDFKNGEGGVGNLLASALGVIPLLGWSKGIKLLKHVPNAEKLVKNMDKMNTVMDKLIPSNYVPGLDKATQKVQNTTRDHIIKPIIERVNRGHNKYGTNAFNNMQKVTAGALTVNLHNKGKDVYDAATAWGMPEFPELAPKYDYLVEGLNSDVRNLKIPQGKPWQQHVSIEKVK